MSSICSRDRQGRWECDATNECRGKVRLMEGLVRMKSQKVVCAFCGVLCPAYRRGSLRCVGWVRDLLVRTKAMHQSMTFSANQAASARVLCTSCRYATPISPGSQDVNKPMHSHVQPRNARHASELIEKKRCRRPNALFQNPEILSEQRPNNAF